MWTVWLASAAWAGVPVIHDGAAEIVVADVAARTGLPASQLTSVPLETVLAGPPVALGQATLRRCAGAPVAMSAVELELGRAQAAWSGGDDAGALDHLDLAVALAGCLSELVDTRSVSRGFMLRGALSADPEVAGGEMRTALALAPAAEWPVGYPAEASAILEVQRAVPPSATLDVAPASGASGPWLDGRPASEAGTWTLTPGLHLAQYTTPAGIRSAWLVLAGDSTLVLPGSFRRPILAHVGTPTERPVLALLAAASPGADAAYVADGGGLWLVTREDAGWVASELVPRTVVAPEPAPSKGKRGK